LRSCIKSQNNEQISAKIEAAHARFISAATIVEAYIVVMRRSGDEGALRLKAMLIALAIDVIDFTQSQAELAQDAFHRYGKGIHPARLNMGDCFSYALAKSFGQPLLYKGNDFSQTDVLSA
jgi:ribonuclease VapC